MTEFSDEEFKSIKDKEIEIRGGWLRFSAKIEGLLARWAILLNEVEKKATGKSNEIDLKNFMFVQKLKKVKLLLQQNCPDLYQSYSYLFEYIDEFKKQRNLMAHCYFVWDKSDLNSVIIWDLDDSSGEQKMVPVKYSVIQLNDSFIQSKKDIGNDLNKLNQIINERLKPIIPEMF